MIRFVQIACLAAFLLSALTSWAGEAGACAGESLHGGAHHAEGTLHDAQDQAHADKPAAKTAPDHICPGGCHHHAHAMMKPSCVAASLPFSIKEQGFWPQESGRAQYSPSLYKPPIA